jgi:hypothetical protein
MDLRDRIAAAIQNANESGVMVGYGTMADAVIAELGLTRETGHGTTYPRTPVTDRHLTRYVTAWEDDDA